MREEERARREYEKAIKEAAKEEKLLQQAMEKARQELQSASKEQRAEYQRRLEELEQKLQEAEEKNQRAISMAQQTKRGHLYIISNVGSLGDDVFKIGLTRRLEPTDRIRELGDASVPFEFDIHAMIFNEDAPALESKIHKVFRDNQVNLVNPRKEFFRTSLTNIKKTLNEMGIETKWTMVAEAREYRETLAVQKSQGKDVRELPPPEPNRRETQPPVTQDTPPEPQAHESPNAPQPINLSLPLEPTTDAPELPKADINDATICPSCGETLPMSRIVEGMNTCPACGNVFKVAFE